MGIQCADCGKFVSHESMLDGTAHFHFEPDSHFGPEVSEWTCATCVLINRAQREVANMDESHDPSP